MTNSDERSSAPPPARGSEALLRTLMGEYLSLVKGVTNVLDGVENLAEATEGKEAERMDLLRRQLSRLLLMHGVRPTTRLGDKLDPRYQEVAETEARTDVPSDTITAIHKAGYEVLVRGFAPVLLSYARVVVATPADTAQPEEDESTSTQHDTTDGGKEDSIP